MTAPALTAATKKDLPNHRSEASQTLVDFSLICRDLYGGTVQMRKVGTRYLPQGRKEHGDDYAARKARSVLFNGLARTVWGLAGMVFREDPQLDDSVPAAIRTAWEDIDLAGTHGDIFIRQLFEWGVLEGHAGILVDAPVVEAGRPLTLADEEAAAIRPYWSIIRLCDIMSWRWTRLGGEIALTQLVLRSAETRPDGAFGDAAVTTYRVYRLVVGDTAEQVVWEEWEQTDPTRDPVPIRSGTIANVTRIPFSVFYAQKTGVLESSPPLRDLADLNVAHWQTASDHRWGLYMASVPTGVLTGVDSDQEYSVGPNSWIKVADPQGKAYYLEHTGKAFASTRQEKEDLKAEMAAIGLGMLVRETRAAETAEAKRIDKGEQDSKLAVMARSLEDAVEGAMGFHAQMIGQTGGGGEIDVSKHFDTEPLEASEVAEYRAMVRDKQMSLETLWQILQDRDFLPDAVDFEEEKQRIEDEKGEAPPMAPPPPGVAPAVPAPAPAPDLQPA